MVCGSQASASPVYLLEMEIFWGLGVTKQAELPFATPTFYTEVTSHVIFPSTFLLVCVWKHTGPGVRPLHPGGLCRLLVWSWLSSGLSGHLGENQWMQGLPMSLYLSNKKKGTMWTHSWGGSRSSTLIRSSGDF